MTSINFLLWRRAHLNISECWKIGIFTRSGTPSKAIVVILRMCSPCSSSKYRNDSIEKVGGLQMFISWFPWFSWFRV